MKRFLLISILLIAFVLRVNQLNTLPSGMTDDEVREVYSSYSLWHTGRDVTQSILLPFSFVFHDFSFNPVPIYITAPFVGLLGLSPFSGRLPYALAGVGVVFLTYLLVKRLLANHVIALLAAGVLSVNVWAIQLSRLAHEAGFAFLFYLWGTVVFVGDWKHHPLRSMLSSMGLFFLAFNSYNATKILYVPLLLLLFWYRRKDVFAGRRRILSIAASVLVTIGVFTYFTFVQGASVHGGNFSILQDTTSAAGSVELARRASGAPAILQSLYHNKATYFIDIVSRHFLYAFSPDFLFLNQEASGIFSLWSRGNFYLIEAPFLLIGLFYLWKNKKHICVLVLLSVCIGALPAALGPPPFTYATRASFMLPWFALCIAAGLYMVGKKFRLLVPILAVLYIYYIAGYLNQYYFEWPRYNAASFQKDQKDLSAFIAAYPDSNANFYISNVSDMFFLQYALFTRTNPRIVQAAYKINATPATLGIMHIEPDCITPALTPVGSLYLNKTCYTENPDFVIPFPDGTAAWSIYKGADIVNAN